jgi:hypothetical protein
MKKALYLSISIFALLCALSTSSRLFAQEYTITPASKSVSVDVACNAGGIAEVDFNNSTGGLICLNWQVIYNSVPRCWDISLCDYDLCFTNVPSSRTMDSVPVGGHGFLKLNVFLNDTGGTGTLKFLVRSCSATSGGDTVTLTVNGCPTGPTCTPSGILSAKQASVNAFSISPNPASDFVSFDLEESYAKSADYRVFDLLGNQLLAGNLNGPHTRIALQSLQSGVYMVKCTSASGCQTRRLVKN